jgi:hypothetical protein
MRLLAALFLLSALCGCDKAGQSAGVTRLELPSNAIETEAKPRKVVRGQVLYVPCYSHVYLLDGKSYNLAITLSLRNTSRTDKLIVTSVAYHDSSGGLVKELAPKEIEMAPLSVAEMFVHEKDTSGGSGASFVVRWVAESAISDPVVEAAMVGSSGSLGVSFSSSSRVIEQLPSPTPTPRPTP